MELLENEQEMQKNKKTKAIMIAIVVIIILLICLSAVIMYMIQDVQKNTTKLVIDTKAITKFSSDMFLFEDDTIYISIREFAELLGYKGFNGDHTSESSTKGYIQNAFEEASYTLNSNKLYKRLLDGNDNEYFELEKPVKIQNNKLYMSIDGVQIATASSIKYDESNKKFTVYTLASYVKAYTENFKDAAISGETADYSNQKALLYNRVVVTRLNSEGASTGQYGVKDEKGNEIIGIKYANIQYVESTNEFIVKTNEGKMGILSESGATKISPSYDEIKQIDKNLNLYLVKNNNKYGVINQNGNIVIYLEHDQIGIDITQFESNNIKNQYLIFDNCIPVKRNNKWGFFDKTGKLIIPIEYNSVGCVVGTQEGTSSQNLLIIPEYEAIVVSKNNKYGLVNSLGDVLIGCVLNSIYSVTTSGQNTYWMEQIKSNEVTVKKDVIEWLQQNGKQKPIKDKTEENTNVNTNETPNQNAQTNTTTNSNLENNKNMTTNIVKNSIQ